MDRERFLNLMNYVALLIMAAALAGGFLGGWSRLAALGALGACGVLQGVVIALVGESDENEAP